MILTSNDRSLVISIVSPFGDTALLGAIYVLYCRSSIGSRHAECKGFAECNLENYFRGKTLKHSLLFSNILINGLDLKCLPPIVVNNEVRNY